MELLSLADSLSWFSVNPPLYTFGGIGHYNKNPLIECTFLHFDEILLYIEQD